MSNNYIDAGNEPTQPVRPSSYQDHNQQGKLVLGSFKNQSGQSQRRPYQYSPQANAAGQPAAYSGRAEQAAPMAQPNANQYPYYQSSQSMNRRGAKRGPRRRGKGCLITMLIVILLVCIIGGFTVTTTQRVLAFGSAISTQSPLSTQTGYMGTSDRTDVLVMGYGGGTHDGANLTDSMLVVSLLPQSHHTSLISVPRDLWVQYPPNSGNYTKLNSIYALASNNGQQPVTGGDAAAAKISLITGQNVKYWLTINFTGFRELIDSIGGVDVYVPDSFTAQYPKNDDPAIDASWIKVHFNKGNQHMDGETAIRYARAREVLDNLAEGTDFARSARQQIIIKAALAKVKQMSTWPKLFNAMDALQHTIYTNMSLADLMQFAMKMDLNDPHTSHIGLSNQNALQDGTSNDGQYILQPANGNWQGIIDYVNQHLYN
ncbi:MAG TPA: LCP family protein [Ktedonobacteraceae bacterium]|nr:LCP family protein [Ktedonobacteraceae bacterium]